MEKVIHSIPASAAWQGLGSQRGGCAVVESRTWTTSLCAALLHPIVPSAIQVWGTISTLAAWSSPLSSPNTPHSCLASPLSSPTLTCCLSNIFPLRQRVVWGQGAANPTMSCSTSRHDSRTGGRRGGAKRGAAAPSLLGMHMPVTDGCLPPTLSFVRLLHLLARWSIGQGSPSACQQSWFQCWTWPSPHQRDVEP